MANDRIYIHELVDIIGANRTKYMHHMTAGFAHVREEHEQKCVGVWAEIGTTGNWPRTINLWEQEGWDGLAIHLELETTGAKRSNSAALGAMEPAEAEWWKAASEFRRGGRDRILRPAEWTRTIDQLLADGVKGAVYAHERIWTPPGRSLDYLDQLRDVGLSAYRSVGAELVGAFDNALINGRECIVIWAFPTWSSWAQLEKSWTTSDIFTSFRQSAAPIIDRFERRLMSDNPLNPMVLGRQPLESDRRPFTEL